MNFAFAYPLLLMAGWIAAWLVNIQARAMFEWSAEADAVYWMAAKLIVWVLPTVIFVKCRQKAAIADYFSLRDPMSGLAFGVVIGLAVLAVSFALDFILGGASFNLPVIDLTLFSSLVVTPFAEEWALRGFYSRSLIEGVMMPRMEPKTANIYAASVFVAMHMPGWYFQGRLREPLGLLQPAIFLYLFGLVLGWSKAAGSRSAWSKQSGFKGSSLSLYTPIVVHALNNLYVAARG